MAEGAEGPGEGVGEAVGSSRGIAWMTCRCTLGLQSASIWRSAAASASVTVNPHSVLIATQSVAYWHQ